MEELTSGISPVWIWAAASLVLWLLALGNLAGALRGPGFKRRLSRLISALLLGCLGTIAGAGGMMARLFSAFTDRALVAQVTTVPVGSQEFDLHYRTVEQERLSPEPQVFRLRGDQWSVGGGIVTWHPLLMIAGLKSYHRPMRVSGQYESIEQQRSVAPTAYAIGPRVDWFWKGLYWAGSAMPGVDTVYGSAAYAYVEPGVVQEVYVTPTGYLIRRVEGKQDRLPR